MPAWKDASPPGAAVRPVLGLVRRAATSEVFTTARFPAGAELAPWVEHLWTVDWDLGDAPAVESTVISFPALHLTAEWGPAGEVRHGVAMPATLVHGTVSRVFRVRLQGRGAVVGARFSAGGAFAWTGVDAGTLRDRAVPAAGLVGPHLGDLHRGPADRPAATRADEFRAALVAHRPAPGSADDELAALLLRMEQDVDLVRVEQLEAIAGCSIRTLQRRFRRHLGVSPKWVLARFRLQQAAFALEREPDVDLADLAVRLGWYDQAHLTNDFRRMLGETPSAYAARARIR